MARPPGIIDRVNYVVEMWSNPCNTPWVVYVETALPAALDAIIAVACFDIGDVLRFVFRPANLRSGRHSRRGKKGRHGRKPKGIRAKLANKLPVFKKLTQRKVTQGVKNLWIIDGIGQRLMWWWLVVDIATFTAYNWTSMIYKTERCQMALGPGGMLRTGGAQTFLGLLGWNDVSFADLEYQTGAVSSTAFTFAYGPGTYNVVAGVTISEITLPGTTVKSRIVIIGTPALKNEPSGEIGQVPGKDQGLICTATVKGPAAGFVEVFVDQGFAVASSKMISIIGQPPFFPPPIKFKCNSPFFPD
ncbi:hypothetical protein LCGC14_2883980 [marine sediment metagenome]|uniref:Uncharacterized protein n=1 Tax=marine sediment metagenome TaxID=412755 RepID=A0A0F8XZB7_9ZZZZ